MPKPLTQVPIEIVANTSVAWKCVAEGFDPADGWTLRYAFEGASELDVAASVESDGFLVELSAAQNTLTPGAYRWQAFASNVGPPAERVQISAGRLVVVGDLEAETGLGEQKTKSQEIVEALEAYILGAATSGQLNMSINGRSIGRIPILDAQQLLNRYRVKAESDRIALAQGARPGKRRRVKVRF